MKVYADTSFMLPLYLPDRHSPAAQAQMARNPQAFLTPFQQAEVTNAIYQQVFRRNIPLAVAAETCATFEGDFGTGVWLPVSFPVRVFDRCIDLARKHVASLGVRTLDSLHVAAALELGASHFWTFDERQARLAEAEGLRTN